MFQRCLHYPQASLVLPSLSLHWKDKFPDFPSLGWTMLSQKWLMHWHDPTSCHFFSSPLSPFLHLTCCPHLRSTCFPLLHYPITQREVFLKTLDPSTFVLVLLSPPSATTSVEHTVTSPACPFTPVTDLCFRFFPHTTQTCQFLKHTMSPVKRITIFFQPSPLPSFPGRPAALGTLFANSSLPAFSCHPSPTSSKPTLRTPRTWALCLPL